MEDFLEYVRSITYSNFYESGEELYKKNKVKYKQSKVYGKKKEHQFEVSEDNKDFHTSIKEDEEYEFYCTCNESKEYTSLCKHQVACSLYYDENLKDDYDIPNIIFMDNINKAKAKIVTDVTEVALKPIIRLNLNGGINVGFTFNDPKKPLPLMDLANSGKYFKYDKTYKINKPVKEFVNIISLHEDNSSSYSNYTGSNWYALSYSTLPFLKKLLMEVEGVYLSEKSKFDYLPIQITNEVIPRIVIKDNVLEVKSNVKRITNNFSYDNNYFYINDDHVIFDLITNVDKLKLSTKTLNKFIEDVYTTLDIKDYVELDDYIESNLSYVSVDDLKLTKVGKSLVVDVDKSGIIVSEDKNLQKLLAIGKKDHHYEYKAPELIEEFLDYVKDNNSLNNDVNALMKDLSEFITLEFDYKDDKLFAKLGLNKLPKDILEYDTRFTSYDDGYISLKELEEYKDVFKMFHLNPNTVKETQEISKVFVYTIFNSTNAFIQKAKKSDSIYKLYDSIINHNFDYELPTGVNAKLRDYQVYGYKYLKMLDKFGFGGILADEMGLGKTLQVLTFLKSKMPLNKPVLIVTPTTVMYNWGKEIDKFIESINYTFVVGNKPVRRKVIKEKRDIYITTYALLRNDMDLYIDKEFSYVFFDEAQYLKSVNAKVRSAARDLIGRKYAITGTPIENSVLELWSIMDIINPNSLGSFANFKRTFYKKDNELSILHDSVKNFILRRLKKDVLKELPDKVETEIYIDLNKRQRDEYNKLIDQYSGEVTKSISEYGLHKSYMTILTLLTRMRQVCCHPSLFLDSYYSGSAKLEALLSLVEEFTSEGRKLIIFSQFKSMLDIISFELKELNFKHVYLHGGIPQSKRQSIIEEYNGEDIEIILISMKAGATGINLTKADTVIIYDPWWNPQLENQAIDRTHRIGQTKNVNVFRLIAKDTIEEKIIEMQANKRRVSDTIIQESDNMLSSLSKDEILKLFTKV